MGGQGCENETIKKRLNDREGRSDQGEGGGGDRRDLDRLEPHAVRDELLTPLDDPGETKGDLSVISAPRFARKGKKAPE